MNINELLLNSEFSKEDIITFLSVTDATSKEQIRQTAFDVMKQNCGELVYLRGLVEFSNHCKNDCHYCGIRKSNSNVERYTLSEEEIIDGAIWCRDRGFGSMVLQSGERSDKSFIDFVERVIMQIKEKTISSKLPNGIGITLSIGEQSYNDYKRLFSAGAHRFLLRIETSSRELYQTLHSAKMSYDRRIECLNHLKEIGYQVGTGVMIGLPGQTIEDLAEDILFFRRMDVDMVGMGPYIPHPDTPMGSLLEEYNERKDKIFQLALLMIAVTRIVLKDVNIASTTALQALYPLGRESGLKYGANVIMPMLTPTERRRQYQLYAGKPCLDEFTSDCSDCVVQRIESTGRKVSLDVWGDPMHFKRKFNATV